MNTLFERFFLPLLVVISLLYAFQSLGVSPMIHLKKVYHHRSDKSKHLERGSLVFYFAQNPIVNRLETKRIDDTHEERIFFFPNAVIGSRESKQMINRINNQKTAYNILIEPVDLPMKGIRVTIRYDLNKIVLSYESFESIGMQKGIIFRLFNKELLDRLDKQSSRPILQTSWVNPKPRIVIDCGHGGKDKGAIGIGGLQEKDVCLSIGTTLTSLLRDQGYQVLLTRNADQDVLLDERTGFANASSADLLISIHANYAFNQNVAGIETFYMKPNICALQWCALDTKGKRVVDTISTQLGNQSDQLANQVQRQVCKSVASYHKKKVDRRVKPAVAQVLLGSQMPAILVEVGFLSNKHEAKLLATQEYQYELARGICKGVMAYIT